MFFILRCVFWLSVVFAHLPAGEGSSVSAGQFLDMASRHVDSFARHSVAQAANTGAAWCQTHGEACADAVLAAMRTKASGATPRLDTLTAADSAAGSPPRRTRG